jgi:hypothetical protein
MSSPAQKGVFGLDYVPFSISDSDAMSEADAVRSKRSGVSPLRDRPARGKSNSPAAWSLALIPVASTGLVLGMAFFEHQLRIEVVLAVAALAVPVGVLFAMLDQRRLLIRGFKQRTSPYLALVPLLYLAVRGQRCLREEFEGLGPLVLHIAVGLVQFAAATIFFPWISAAIYLRGQVS